MVSLVSFARRLAAWILIGLLSLIFIGSAVFKLSQGKEAVEGFAKLNMTSWLVIIGVGELVSALLFLIPKTHSAGVLLLSSYMGGAIIVHMVQQESVVAPSVILVLIWIAGWLRNPMLLASFHRPPPTLPS
jgi:hypothetical protein